MTVEFTNQAIKFHSDALPEGTLLVRKLSGQERLSTLFRFELELVTQETSLDLEDVLYSAAKVGLSHQLGAGKAWRWFRGVLTDLRVLGKVESWIHYRAVLVPDLWQLAEFHRSRVFQDLDIKGLVTEVLGRDLQLKEEQDFKFVDLQRKLPKREYIVQYEETDWDFLARWLEHEGVFFYFENDGEREQAVFGDGTNAYKPATSEGPRCAYRPEGGGEESKGAEDEVYQFECRVNRGPKQTRLNDYNWRTPTTQLACTADVAQRGVGLQTEYNDHFKDDAEGKALAQVRAEEWTCRSAIYSGQSSARAFRPGRTFELTHHFIDRFNTTYLLVAVQHEAEQLLNIEASSVTSVRYTNTFEAIPADKTFRPARTTDWPSIKGVMHGRVDGPEDGAYAQVDDQGRYHVTLPYDEMVRAGKVEPGKASRAIRMAQPYAGTDSGIHFPLLKGTEVIITHVDGDPDRPVIAGAVPNPDTQSPVDSSNATQNRIVTTSGNVFQMDDNERLTGFVSVDGGGRHIRDFRMPRIDGGPETADAGTEDDKTVLLEVYKSQLPPDHRTQVELGEVLLAAEGMLFPDDFTLDAYNADMGYSVSCGDSVSISSGSSWSYANSPLAVDLATGPRIEVSKWLGPVVSNSMWMGTKVSTGLTLGTETDTSVFIGGKVSTDMFVGVEASTSISVAGKTSLSITVAAEAAVNITVAGKAEVNINVAGELTLNVDLALKAHLDIELSGDAYIKLAASASIAVEIAAELLDIKIPGETKVDLADLETRLTRTQAQLAHTRMRLTATDTQLQETRTGLQDTNTKLQDTQTKLQETGTKLQDTQTKLQDTGTKLQETETKLQETKTAAQAQTTALNNSQTAAVHTIT